MPSLNLRRLVARALLAVSLGGTAALAQLTVTPSTTEGPYYPFNSGQTLPTAWLVGADNDLTAVTGRTSAASGTLFLLSGTLVNTAGTPIPGATIELWQADNSGVYYYGSAAGNNTSARDQNFQSYGTCTSDASGNWSFRTIRPGLYTGRIRHFHFKVNVGGTTRLTSQFMFAADSALYASDNVAATLVAAGTMPLVTLSPETGTDSGGATALIASKQIVINYAVTSTTTAPAITTQPSSATASVGGTASFSVAASGTAPLTYQWHKDGVAVSGAASSTYTITSVTSAHAGSYTVVVTNSAGAVTSSAAVLTVGGASSSSSAYLINLSARAYLPSSSSVLIAGFVIRTADGKDVLVRAVGPTLSEFGVSNALADPSLEVFDASASSVAANQDWDASLGTTFSNVGAFALPSGSKDAALTINLPTGVASAHVRGTSAGVALVEAYDTAAALNSRLINLSARSYVGTGDSVLIAGFVIGGSGAKRLLIRGVGPRLSVYGVSGPLADPVLTVYDSEGTALAQNDDWDASLASTFSSVGAFDLVTGSTDAAIVLTLPAGRAYSAIVAGKANATGEALVELYELE